MNKQLLKFGDGSENAKLKKLEAKLGKKVYTFSLPAGYSCPGAKACLTKFDRKIGKIVDGPSQEFRCFAASMEGVFKGFRENTSHNFELLKGKTIGQMHALILESLPPRAEIIRIHVSGDFFSGAYFRAWLQVAFDRPDIEFYAYTKSIPFWIDAAALDMIPSNMHLTASEGGKFDSLITQYALKSSHVVFSVEEAGVLGLEIDHDDSHAAAGSASFALLIHGTQPKGSRSAEALRSL